MRTAVATSHLRVTPGKPVVLDVEVTNTADIIDGVTATIQGLDSAWVSLMVPVVSLFPEATSTLSLKIDLPTNCLAGEYLVSVRVVSIIDPERFSDHEFWLSVEPLLAASVTMHPSVIVGGSNAVFVASIANEGNVIADLVINTIDETRQLTCVAYPATVSVPAGETHSVEIHVDGPRPWFGQPVSRNVNITVSNADLSIPALATFTQKPRIPRGLLTILILAAIIALWATVFLLVVSLLRNQPDPTKDVAKDFNAGGSGEVNLDAVAVSISGLVLAESTQQPLPLITVEAFRVPPSGDQILAASTGTAEDGTYSLESLLPGRYKLRFSATGFVEVWYPAATDFGSAAEFPILAGEAAPDKGVQMVGVRGSMAGQVIAPENRGAAADISVTIVQDPIPGQPLPTEVPAQVDGTGAFRLGDMITPATYKIQVKATGFETTTFVETLAGGENKVLNTVILGAAAGGFTGVVTDSQGAGLGAVDIVVRSGDFEIATKTPTSGNVGAFKIEALETPRTYTLTFSLDGFTDQTIAVDLGSGETKPVAVTLLGGQGTVSGLVTDTKGTPLGGVTANVGCGTFTATTATLTDSGAAGQAGTYTVSGVPTPSSCTITFTSREFVSQTVRADLAGSQPVTGLNAILPRALGSVEGTVLNNGTPIADVIVELTSGTAPRTTVTATAPLGAFRFADVAPGDYTITFRKAGLSTRVAIVTVTPDTVTTRSIDLPTGP